MLTLSRFFVILFRIYHLPTQRFSVFPIPKMDYLAKLILLCLLAVTTHCQRNVTTHYATDHLSEGKLELLLCPADVTSIAGTFELAKSGKPYNISEGASKIFEISFSLNVSEKCHTTAGFRYRLYLNFRSFWLAGNKEPAFQVTVEDVHGGGGPKTPTFSNVDYFSQDYGYYPRSELQYYSSVSEKNVSHIVKLNLAKDIYTSDKEPVVFDFVLVLDHPYVFQSGNNSQRCNVLDGWVPTYAYCLPVQTGFISCPQNCSRALSDYRGNASRFDKDGFSYGSCGAERRPEACGEAMGFRPVEKIDFIIPRNTLIGITCGAVLTFIIAPIAVFCVVFYRKRQF